jgi:ADP-ribose pyrophosphatase YjhB (NUDIX family)
MNKIKSIRTIYQKDIFPEMTVTNPDVDCVDRLTGKAIIIDTEGKIALVAEKNLIYTLPGGGIDAGESIENGIIREMLEETGCSVKINFILGCTDDYRNRDKKHCINYCAVSKVIGEKGDAKLTDEETKNGLHVKWFTIGNAIEILNKEKEAVLRGEIKFYNTAYNIIRDNIFLLEYTKKNSKN